MRQMRRRLCAHLLGALRRLARKVAAHGGEVDETIGSARAHGRMYHVRASAAHRELLVVGGRALDQHACPVEAALEHEGVGEADACIRTQLDEGARLPVAHAAQRQEDHPVLPVLRHRILADALWHEAIKLGATMHRAQLH